MFRRTCTALAAVATALTATAALAPAATADVTYPILPNQYFTGLVNGSTVSARIFVGCVGPAGGTGHPLPGQTLEVRPLPNPTAITADVGYTGSAGRSVLVEFPSQSSVTVIDFSTYYTVASIPTSLTLPCSGTGKVAFAPEPGSGTAVTAYVTVSYVAQP